MSLELVTSTYLDLYAVATVDGKVLLKKYSKQGLEPLIIQAELGASASELHNLHATAIALFQDYAVQSLHNELETTHLNVVSQYVIEKSAPEYSAEHHATPSTYDGKAQSDPLGTFIKTCANGDDLECSDGLYKWVTIDRPISASIHARNRHQTVIKRNPVSGSYNIYFKKNAPVKFYGIAVEADDTAGCMFNNPHGAFTFDDIEFDDCRFVGGFDPEANVIAHQGKWGFLTYALNNFKFTNGYVGGIEKEHAFYHHNIQGPMLIEGSTIEHCGRTAVQVVARTGEGPSGSGDIMLRNLQINDVCIENGGGGSAITLAGGHAGRVVVENCIVKLGCNQALSAPWNKNITGGLVSWFGGGSHAAKADLSIRGSHFEVGEFYTGTGYARRTNVSVGNLGGLEIIGTTIKQWPGAREALEIKAGGINHITLDSENVVIGECIYGGVRYKDLALDGSGYKKMLDAIKDDPKVTIL